MLFVKLYKQKGKMKEKTSNMKEKIQIQVKDLTQIIHIINNSTEINKFVKIC